jgi:hypothetical protein
MKYREIVKYKYELMEDIHFKVRLPAACIENNPYFHITSLTLFINKHYAWDGSSIPLKKSWGLFWDSDRFCKRASLVHDSLCQLIRAGSLDLHHRLYADGLYRDMCIEDGMPKWQANMRYWALRKFGGTEVVKPENPIIEV